MVFHPDTQKHLLSHHGDFSSFADIMVETSARRFDAVFWGIVQQYANAVNKLIVDFGTGPGLLLPELADRFVSARVVGVEGQPEMLKRAKKLIEGRSRIELIIHDLTVPGVPGLSDRSVDLLFASMLLHEFQRPTLLLDEMARVTRPGGVVIAYDWVRQPLHTYFDGNRPGTLDQFNHFSEHCRYTPEDITWLFHSSGFEVVEWISRRSGRLAIWAAVRQE